jgi:hypothetical protein
MVTPNSPNPQTEELISAWLDDAAPTDGSSTDWTDRVLSQADAADVCADYLRIGALLNPQRVAAAPVREDSDAFWQRLEGRLRDDVVHPHRHVASSQHPSPTIDPHASASNAAVFRWSAFGSLAAVVVVAGLWGTGMVGDTLAPAQLALQAPPAPPSTQTTLVASAPSVVDGVDTFRVSATSSAQGVMPTVESTLLRDPALDALLAAHRQRGSASAFQGPVGFVRNVAWQAGTP